MRMKNLLEQKLQLSLACLACLALVVTSGHAQSLIYSPTQPGFGANDINNLSAGVDDAGNVNAGDDAATYLAHDRGAIGQTFTTGNSAAGYNLSGVWMQHATYSNTWWDVTQSGGVQLVYRLTDPSAAGTAGFVLDSETYNVTGAEANNMGTGFPGVGSGTWVYFELSGPITLAPNTVYGFDVATGASSPNYFFETAGDNADVYAGGEAYTTVRGGNVMTTFSGGDHVFGVMLTAVPEPSTLALVGLGGLALMFYRKRRA